MFLFICHFWMLFYIIHMDSNTSHVLIYPTPLNRKVLMFLIQIHLMFLFIRNHSISKSKGAIIQIHLMFLFIPHTVQQYAITTVIQIHLMFLFIFLSYLKNSITQPFKYISCSYLSSFTNNYGLSTSQFKYISCSYLSTVPAVLILKPSYSNTSHVLIYHKWKT